MIIKWWTINEMDLNSCAYISCMDPRLNKGISGLLNSTWTCIGPKSRLNLKNFLTTMYYLLCVKV